MGVPVNVGDRVLVATSTAGTGAYDLGAAVSGYLTPALAGVTSGSRVAYVVVDSLTNPSLFEIGEGTYTSAATPTVSRTLIVRNTTGGTSAVSWSSGTKYLFFAPSASRFVVYDTDGGLVLNNAGVTGVASINSGPLAGFRNAVINGNFDIWQRGTSFSSFVTDFYSSDRWLIYFDGTGGTRTISRQAFTLGQTAVPGEPTYFYRFNQSVAGSGVTYNVLTQRIEDVRTFAGQQVTLSFYAKAAASLTMPLIALRQYFASGGSPSYFVDTVVGVSLVVGTSFSKYTYTVTVPSISGKTLGTDGNSYLELILYLPISTTFTFDLAQVQLEVGSVATPFERRPLGVELALCQRYFQKSYTIDTSPGTSSFSGAVSKSPDATTNFAHFGPIRFQTTMRASPSISLFNTQTGATLNPIRNENTSTDVPSVVYNIGVGGFGVYVDNTSVAGANLMSTHYTASAEL